MSKRIAIFPGSFDPYTKGHHDLVERSKNLFDEIIIAIGVNSAKKRLFSTEEMAEKINSLYKDSHNISVITYKELTASLATSKNANYILRGIRNSTDLNYESPIAQANNFINNNLESIFLICNPKYAFISSSIVRDLHQHGQDISELLPYEL